MKKGLLGLFIMAAAVLLTGAKADAFEIVCSSNGYRYSECRIPYGAQARIIQQLSSRTNQGGDCVERFSWGTVRDVLWVDHGCRARFEVMDRHNPPPSHGQLVQCDSVDYRYNRCYVDMSPRSRVELVRQDSRRTREGGDCIQGSTWGYNRNSIWVDRGCRGLFRVDGEGRRRW